MLCKRSKCVSVIGISIVSKSAIHTDHSCSCNCLLGSRGTLPVFDVKAPYFIKGCNWNRCMLVKKRIFMHGDSAKAKY